MNFRKDIQGLRALAVIFVFIFHLSNSFLPGGFIGVDMFFVISGYLVSGIILSKMDKNQFNIVDFYESRIKRIVPAYFFLLIATWIGFYFVYINTDIGNFKLSHFWATIFNANHFFAGFDDYFGATSTEMPLLHTWTLGVEMQFYLILPILLFIRNRKYLTILLIILTVLIVCYTSYEIFYNNNKMTMYFSVFARSAEFFIGVLLALTKIEQTSFVKRNVNLISVLGLVLMLITLLLYNESTPFPGLYSLLPCLAISCLLISPVSKVNNVLSNKPLVYIGEISYSVYLWHWPVMAFWRYYTNRYEFSPIEIFAIVTLTIFASLLSYYLIEKPLRTRSRKIVFTVLSLFLVVNILLIYFTTPMKFARENIPLEYISQINAKNSHANNFTLAPSFGDTLQRDNRILLLGNSHALSFITYLDQLGIKEGFAFKSITMDTYLTMPYQSKSIFKEIESWDIYQKLLPHINKNFETADLIILFMQTDGRLWEEGINKTMNNLKPTQRLLIVNDYPYIDVNPVRKNRGILKSDAKGYQYIINRDTIHDSIQQLIKKHNNVRIVRLKDQEFFKDVPYYQDTLMYYDAGHMNTYGMQKYEEATGKEFMQYVRWGLVK